MKKLKKLFVFLTVFCLLFAAGCAFEQPQTEETTVASVPDTEAATAPDITEAETAAPVEASIGAGATVFGFTVTFADGMQHIYTVSTNKTTVGDALEELGLISGEQGPYGLYVKVVDGVTADYNDDGSYWAFYADGAYVNSGISETEIDSDVQYEMRVEFM